MNSTDAILLHKNVVNGVFTTAMTTANSFQNIKEKQHVYSPQFIFVCFLFGPRADQKNNL